MIDIDQVAEDLNTVPRDEQLRTVSELVHRMHQLENEVADLDMMLSARKKDLRQVSDDLLPSAMMEAGVSLFGTPDGLNVSIKAFYEGSIPVGNRDEAHAWLRDHGHADLIKHTLKAAFGKGEEELALAVRRAMEKEGALVQDQEAVHPQTLKAFLREQIEGGASLPLDLFGTMVGHRAAFKKK